MFQYCIELSNQRAQAYQKHCPHCLPCSTNLSRKPKPCPRNNKNRNELSQHQHSQLSGAVIENRDDELVACIGLALC